VPSDPAILIESTRIFDRWGNKVFQMLNFHPSDFPQFWDGTFNGTLVNQGVYIYIIDYTDELGRKKQVKGDLTIIR
jgi:gliding motility-associated-like protein